MLCNERCQVIQYRSNKVKVIGSGNMRLACEGCGAVYRDVWSTAPSSGMPSPVCPYCGVSHYEDTEEDYHKPVKEMYGGQKRTE